jgi:ketosteroid isomerase-like protein
MVKTSIMIGLTMFLALSGCSPNAKKMTNLEIVKSTYEGRLRRKTAKIWLNMWPTTCPGPKPKDFLMPGTYIGLESVTKNVFSRLASEWIDYKFTPENYVASDDKVVAYGSYTGIYKITNKPFAARVAHIWQLKDDKIIKFEQFVDSKPVNDAME